MWGGRSSRLFPLWAGLILAAIAPTGRALAEPGRAISRVVVEKQGDVTRIVLRGPQNPVYTAFMRSDPPRLIVELPEVSVDAPTDPMEVRNGLVDTVTVGSFGDKDLALSLARVSITLSRSAEYELKPGDGELVVEVRPEAGGTLTQGPSTAQVEAPPAAQASDAASEPPPASEPAQPSEPTQEPTQEPAAELAQAPEPANPGAAELVAPAAQESALEPSPSPEATAQPGDSTDVPAESAARAEEAAKPEPKKSARAAAVQPPRARPAASAKQGKSAKQARGDARGKSDAPPRITRVVPGAKSIEIRAGARLERHDLFALKDPERLVLDLPGARSGLKRTKLAVNDGPVSQIRVGEHEGKLRLVLDLRGSLPEYRFESTPTGALIFFGAAPQQAAAAAENADSPEHAAAAPGAEPGAQPGETPAAPAPEGEPASEPASAETEPGAAPEQARVPGEVAVVRNAHFESTSDFDRVVVEFDHAVEAKIVEPDPGTLIVRLIGARIERSQERRVDTKEFGGPVQIFSIFQTPDVKEPEVRIVLKRYAKVPGQIHWDGAHLNLQLARGPEFHAANPAPAPGATASAAAAPAPQPAPGGSAASGVPSAALPVPAEPGSGGAEEELQVADPFAFAGPSDPASIDILEEGGFSPDKAYSGRRISLDFKDADMGNILRLIAEVSDLNVIAGEEVTGKVTIRLVDVPWDQALDVILLTKGLGFERKGNVLRIAPLEALKLEKEARLQEARSREKLEDLQVKLQPVNYANVDDVKELVKRLLSKRGSCDVDKRTSTLIIKDIASVVQEATALVKAIDTATPQVLIEAKIVEANLTFSRSLGAVWGLGYRALGAQAGSPDLRFADAGDPNNLPAGVSGLTGLNNNFTSSNPASGNISGLLNLGLLSLDDHLNLDLQLQAAEENDKGKVISSPRIVTLDNTEADIKQGVAIAFSESTADRLTTSFIDAVLELKVTPHITADRSIIMKILVSRNAPQLSASKGTVSGIAKNETKTEALVRDGETVVLGGIYVVDTGSQGTKVPFLADIPLLGSAFRSHTINDVRRELLIFVTPRVVMGSPTDAL